MRTILVLLAFVLFFICFLPVLGVLWLIRKKNPKLASEATFHIIQGFLKFELFLSGTRLRIEGREQLPEGTVLFVGNHRSDFDALCTYSSLDRPTGYVAKKELMVIPILKQWMLMMNCIFIDRKDIRAGMKSILEAIEIAKSGQSIFIFPEGTRNRNADMDVPMDFKEGSLKIAQKAEIPIVPVAIKNSEACFEKQKPWVRAADVRVTFLKPVSFSDIPEEFKKKPASYIRLLIEEDLKRPL